MMVKPAGGAQSVSRSMRQVAGVACRTFAPEVSSIAASRNGSAASSRVATTTRPPVVSGTHISTAAMSNDTVVTDRMTESVPMPGRRPMESSRLDTEPWRTITPFGRPVDPEV